MSTFGGSNRERSVSISSTPEDHAKRRSSNRKSKRPKFDDELVESSLGGQGVPLQGKIRSKSFSVSVPDSPVAQTPSTSTAHDSRKRVNTKNQSGLATKRARKGRSPMQTPTKDSVQWKPTDDLLLIQGVQQTCDLSTVHRGVKFSCKFAFTEVQDRWHALLYDPVVSRVAMQAIHGLHPEQISVIQSKALFSKAEEEVLASIKSIMAPEVELFEAALTSHAHVFHPGRHGRVLFAHWIAMKQNYLLNDQIGFSKQTVPQTFEDFEQKLIESEQTASPVDEQHEEDMQRENALASRSNHLQIVKLEERIARVNVLVEDVTGVSQSTFDDNTLATIKGRLVKFNMRSDNLTFGRCTKTCRVDVDLSLDGPAWKVSRRQGILSHKGHGTFVLSNEGQRPVFVDGKPVLTGSNVHIFNNSVVEIEQLKYIFLINPKLLAGSWPPKVKKEQEEGLPRQLV